MDDLALDPDTLPGASQFLLAEQRNARATVIGSLGDDPEKAARAQELAEATGAHPVLVHANLENFEAQHKAALTSELLKNNSYLQEYVNSHPLAASVSNDDFGQLDAVSQKVQQIHAPASILSKAIEGWNEGVGEGGLGQWMLSSPGGAEFVAQHRLSAATLSVLGSPIEVPFRTIGGVIGAGTKAAAQTYASITGDQAGADKAGEVVQGVLMDPAIGVMLHALPHPPPAELNALARQAQKTARTVKPYVDAGVEPPVGVDALVDQAKQQQAEVDGDNLKEALKESSASATRERSPELFANFVRQHTDAKIGISAEAIRELYGDKPPSADDGILGWVPGLADQLRLAEAHGGDVEVPLADWLAHVEPQAANKLHDNIRVRAGGMTLEEAKEVKPIKAEGEAIQALAEEEPTTPEAVDSVRQGAVLKTLEETVNDRKLELKKTSSSARYDNVSHTFDMIDNTGKMLGHMDISEEENGKRLYVDNIEARYGANKLGPRAMRDILRQIQQQFPNAESIGGARVSGAREKAGTVETHATARIPLKTLARLSDDEIKNFFYEKKGEQLYNYTGTDVYYRLKDLPSETEKALSDAAEKVLSRIAPKGVELQATSGIVVGEKRARGLHLTFSDRLPMIMLSLDPKLRDFNPDRTIRHEGGHHLRQLGFFDESEWKVLEKAAEDGDWLKKRGFDKLYGHLSKPAQLEEAIVEEYARRYADNPDRLPESRIRSPLDSIFEKMHDILRQIRQAIKQALGKEPSVEDLFEKVESGEIGSRQGRKPLDPNAAHAEIEGQGELDVTRQEDKEMFAKANAIGMTVKQYQKYLELIAKRDTEDMAAAAKANEKEIARRQTKEWKEAAARVREEVKPNILQRPDIASDEFLRTGVLHGEKLKGRPRLDSTKLTPEQRAALPDDYYTPGGMHPDDVAGLFGYASGDAMIARLAQLNKTREGSGLGPKAYVNQLVEAEVNQRMQKEFGDLAQNILEEAKDHVISQTQMDLLHEETLALGMKAGKGFSITKDDLKGQVKDEFAKLPVGGISTDKYLANAGRAGTLAERALLEEKPSDAFKYKQQQYISMLLANEAKRLEKERKGFDKNAKTFSKREVSSVQQDYTNFIHDILGRVGQVVRRSVQDLQESIARGEQTNLEDFVNFKEQHDLRELPVADFLYDPTFRKPLDELTVDQFRAVNDSIKALITNGRDEQKIVRAGEAADLAVVKEKMIDELKTFPERKREVIEGKLDKLKHIARTYLASHLQLESLFNRWDRGDPQGTWTQYVMRDLAVAANYEASLEKKYSRLVAENADKVDLKEKIDNTVFYDPFTFEKDAKGVSRPTANSTLLQFDRKNLRAILQNVGNASNMDKLARGYSVKPEAIMSWLHQHATKEDWNWAQKQGDIFEEINKEAATMYRGLTGIEPEKIEIKPIQTPHGAYAGWYHPVVYDPVWEGQSKKLIGGSALEEDNYVRATTPRGYTKQRTGYAAPLSLYLDQTPVRMKQMLHDIAFRPAVINASKIFYDKEVRAAIAQHYGVEYRDLLVPWLRDVANSGNYRSDAAKVGTMVSEFMRQNIIATLIGFNPGTVMKHGPTAAVNSITEVGPINFLKAVKGLTEVNEATGESNWSFAMNTSEELARRHRHYIETLRGSSEKVLGKQSFRDTMIKLGAYPVAISDLLSAVPTWLAQYEASMKAGEDHGSSIFMADRAVRRAHGSSVITNRPALMRGGPMAQWVSSLYGFFSHILNRQYELAWRAGDTLGLVKEGEYSKAAENVPRLSAMFFSYVIFPALIEELVTPMTNDEKESWGKKAAKGLVRGMASSWIGIRDIAQAALSGHDPAAGLMATTAKAATDLYRDLAKGKETFSKQHAGNIIQHAFTAFGALTGLTNAQEGRTGKFIYNYATGQEKPKGVGDWWHGLRTGTIKERKR